MRQNKRNQWPLDAHIPFSISGIEEHSMTFSLERYLDIKMHQAVRSGDGRILVVGDYDRACEIADCEKNDKPFNYHRPTAETLDDGTVVLKCYPGRDYVRHYAALAETWVRITNQDREVRYVLPTEQKCWDTLENSNIGEVPVSDVAIIGWGLHKLTDQPFTQGSPFVWATDRLDRHSVTYIGCHYSLWSDAGGRFVAWLGHLGFNRVIYVGKLGSLNPDVRPNEFLATGAESAVEDEIVRWTNVFADVRRDNLLHGRHCNCPGVIMETAEWVGRHRDYDFVDSELGQMAKYANSAGIEFSYLHFVSDNVVKKYDEDLAVERREAVIAKREQVLQAWREILFHMP